MYKISARLFSDLSETTVWMLLDEGYTLDEKLAGEFEADEVVTLLDRLLGSRVFCNFTVTKTDTNKPDRIGF